MWKRKIYDSVFDFRSVKTQKNMTEKVRERERGERGKWEECVEIVKERERMGEGGNDIERKKRR